ncbi:hypothetical protein D0A36_20475 [Xanthomonas campestris]|nr:hypothetical protein D0A36_20475 [Xanthomonas campestris]RFF54268.1 hypothetical protein D0A41_18145 [Xanthomonas campestris]
MLALPKMRPKKAAPCSEAEDAMPIPSEAVCPTLPSPAPKGLLRCEMRAVQPACGTPSNRDGRAHLLKALRALRTTAARPACKRLTAHSAAHTRRRPAAPGAATMAGL